MGTHRDVSTEENSLPSTTTVFMKAAEGELGLMHTATHPANFESLGGRMCGLVDLFWLWRGLTLYLKEITEFFNDFSLFFYKNVPFT